MKKFTPEEIEAFARKTYDASLEALEKAQNGVADAIALLHPPILRLLAEGKPAPAEVLAQAVGRSVEEIEKMLVLLPGLEQNRDGAVIGFGLSFIPTPHMLCLHGHEQIVYAWCVPDALILPRLIDERATILSPAQDTGERVTIEISPDAVTKVEPESAVVSWWTAGMNANDLRGTGCVNQNLFRSEKGAATWAKEHEGADILSVVDTFRALEVVRKRQYPHTRIHTKSG